jgi:hypothetical protein
MSRVAALLHFGARSRMYADSRQGIYRGTNEITKYEFFTRAFARICTGLSQLRDGVHALGDFTDLFFIRASHKAKIAQQ